MFGWPSPDGSQLAVVTTDDGGPGVAFCSPVQPPEVYLRDGATLRRRTNSNPAEATAGLVLPTSHRVPTPDDEQIPVFVLSPVLPNGSVVLNVDPQRAALYGGPYGGYMVLAGLSFQPELWAAGVDIVGMSSPVTFLENTSAYRRAYREREYGSVERDREFLEEASPLNRITDIRAPLFVIHGANDPRVPLTEAEQVVAGDLEIEGVSQARVDLPK